MENKIIRNKGTSAVIVVLVLAAFALLNVFAGIVTERFYLKVDMTEAGLFTIDPVAAEYLENMKESVDVIVLREESDWLAEQGTAQVVEILRRYSRLSNGLFRVQYVNPDHNTFDGPEYSNSLAKLGDTHANLREMKRDDIIFLSSRRAELKSLIDLFEMRRAPSGYDEPYLNADAELMAALFYVFSEEVATAVLLEGHDEDEPEALRVLFERSGYDVVNINLTRDELPEGALIVISAGPKKDFLAVETAKLAEYLSAGGCVMVFYDFGTPSLTNLDLFLEEWGLSVETKLVFDEVNRHSSTPEWIFGEFRSTDGLLSSIDLAEGREAGLYLARPIRWASENEKWKDMTAKPLITTSHSSSYSLDLNSGEQAPGPFDLAYLVRRDTQNGPANLIVSNMGFVELFEYSYLNMPWMYSIVDELNPFGESVYIEPKNLLGEIMPVSAGQSRVVVILLVVLVPLAIMVAGILVYRRRRHK